MTRPRPARTRHPSSQQLGGRARRALAVGTLALVCATSSVLVAQTAAAAVPAFPDNIIVFPDRDFVSVEGYQDHIGEKGTITVTRGGQVVGRSEGTVAAGDVAFEVNHPGGSCWGVGAPANLQVTPNIVAGDVVTVTFPDGTTADTTVGSGVASDAVLAADGVTVTVTGTLGPDVNRDFIEQRIVNPDMVDTVVARRDVRAVPGPLTPSPKGGYQSGLEVAADGSFTATYVFDTPEAASAAANAPLGERLMSWQEQDPAGNTQGLTIAEFGELGGPGMGGCPAGPGDAAPQPGSVTVVPSTDKTSAQLTWSPATAAAGASPVTNYSLLAIAPAVDGLANAQQAQTGLRFNADARSATIGGLDPATTYAFEVRAISEDGKASAPFTVNTANPGGGEQTPGTAAQLTLAPAPTGDGTAVAAASVTATSTAGTQIWYAADTEVFSAGGLTDAAQPYTGPIPITQQTTLHFAALNAENNVETVTGTYTPETALLATPTGFTATPGQAQVGLEWNAVTEAASYQVRVYDAAGTEITPAPATTTSLGQVVTGLTADTQYQFSVTALAAGRTSPESDKVSATPTAVTDRVSVSRASWKSGDFRVNGTSGANTAVTVYRVNADGSRGPAIANATGTADGTGAFTIRLRNNAPTSNPGRVIVGSSGGGFSTPATVSNG